MRHALFGGQLQRMVIGIDVLRILGRAIICGPEHIGAAGNGVEPRGRSDASHRRYVKCYCLFQVAAVRADVRGTHQDAGRQLALDGQVPVVEGWRLVAVGWIPAHDKQIKRESSARGRWKRGRKQISRRQAAAWHLGRCPRLRAERIAERPRPSRGSSSGSAGKYELWAERRDIYEPIVDDSGNARVIENTRSAAQAGLSIAEQIKRKAPSRREVFQT